MHECDAGFFLRSSLDINTAELCSNKSRKNTANWFKDLLTHTDRNQFHKVWKPVEINLRVRWFERFMKEKERYNASVYRLQNSTQMMSFSKSSRSSSFPPVHSELSPSKITRALVLIRKSASFSNLFGPPQAPKNYKIQLVYWPATTCHAFRTSLELQTQKWTLIEYPFFSEIGCRISEIAVFGNFGFHFSKYRSFRKFPNSFRKKKGMPRRAIF